jgi:hypothetical protein
MKTANRIIENIKSQYVISIIVILGVFAFISATIIAYPALAYIGSKLM